MNCKKIALAVSLAAVFCFIGCGDDSSNSPSAAGGDGTVLSSDSNGGEGGEVTSNDSKDGKEKSAKSTDSKDSKDEKASDDKEKKDSGESKDSSSTSNDSGDSGSTTPSSDSKGDVTSNPSSGGMMSFDSTAFASMFSCSEEGATQNQMGYVSVCTNGQWVYDSTATAEANKCTEEGATKTDSSSMMGMTYATTYVCKDGKWSMNMGSGVSGTPCDVEDSTK